MCDVCVTFLTLRKHNQVPPSSLTGRSEERSWVQTPKDCSLCCANINTFVREMWSSCQDSPQHGVVLNPPERSRRGSEWSWTCTVTSPPSALITRHSVDTRSLLYQHAEWPDKQICNSQKCFLFFRCARHKKNWVLCIIDPLLTTPRPPPFHKNIKRHQYFMRQGVATVLLASKSWGRAARKHTNTFYTERPKTRSGV